MEKVLNPILIKSTKNHCNQLGVSASYAISSANQMEKGLPVFVSNNLIELGKEDRRHLTYTLFGGDENSLNIIGKSRVLVIGVGGVGAETVYSLMKLGIRDFYLIDGDVIEKSNLHKSSIFSTHDVGEAKVDIIAKFLKSQGIKCTTKEIMWNSDVDNYIYKIIQDFDPNIIVWGGDSSENVALADLSDQINNFNEKKIILTGGVIETMVFVGPSITSGTVNAASQLRELDFNKKDHDNDAENSLNPTIYLQANMVSSLLANEALQFLLRPNFPTPLSFRRLVIDLLTLETTTYHLT